jgi:hypothetical protein
MARRETDEWGVRFGVTTDADGYQWQWLPDVTTEGDVLAPAGTMQIEDGTVAMSGETRSKIQRLGRGITKDAVVQFRKLAEALTAAELVHERVIRDEDGNELWIEDERGWPQPALPDSEARTLTADFADRFGMLWGDHDPRTLTAWRDEAAWFLDLDDVARALRTAVFTDFERGMMPVDSGASPRELRWRGLRPFSRPIIIARDGEVTAGKMAINALRERVDYFERAMTGPPRARAQMLFSRAINAKLAGGLSLSASLLTEKKAAVTPLHLIHTLYTRLWLDTSDAEALERQMTCRECDKPITGSRRKQFCSERCRWKFNNRRRATG